MEEGRVWKGEEAVATRRIGRRRGMGTDGARLVGGCGTWPSGVGGSLGTAVPGRTREMQGKRKREKGESGGGWPVGWSIRWGPASGGEGGGMTGGPEPGKEKKEKENRIKLNLKLTLQIYSNLIRPKQDIPKLEKF
jgi:hypothetical protein